jgi:trimeric autotransporter adhesin
MDRQGVKSLACCVAVAVCVLAAPAGVGAAPLPFSAAPVANGPVTAVALDGAGRTYLGGQFSQVGPRIGHGMKLTTADDQPAAGFPDVDGDITAVVGDGSGGWFIGGAFTHVGGVARSRLAHIRSDGSLDPTWDPNADNDVNALARSGTDLYVGGQFAGPDSIGGENRDHIAKLSTTGTGAADPFWNPDANGSVDAVALSGTDLYAGGDFAGASSIGGQDRNHVAKLSTAGTGAADPIWNPNANGRVVALALSGTDLYVGGDFDGPNSIGGQDRKRIAKLSTSGTGAADPAWQADANGTVHALAVSGPDVFAGGDFSSSHSIGGQDRDFVAKLAASDGTVDATWDTGATQAVRALAVSGSSLFVGGAFHSIGGKQRFFVGKVSTTGAGDADPNWNPNANSFVLALAVSGNDVYAGGSFSSAGAANVEREHIARLNADGTLDPTWNPDANGFVDALAVSGTDLYVGGNFAGGGSIGGQDRDYIAKLATTGTGAADPTWNPTADDRVLALAVSGTNLFAGGNFAGAGSIGGQDRNHIAKLTTTGTGAADATWNPNANGPVNALAVSGNDLYAGGSFDGSGSIGGQDRNRIAKLSTTGAGAADPAWNPNANFFVLALAVSGTDLYAGGLFAGANSIGGQDRDRIAKLSTTGTGAADPAWNPDANAPVRALAVSGNELYVGGDFSGSRSIGGQDRIHLARLTTTGTGVADPSWGPSANGAVDALAVSDRWLAVGGHFVTVGPLSTNGIALFGRSGPTITIAAPIDGATYTQGQSVAASYACSDPDGPADIAGCAGPVASGAPIDTANTGPHSFTVTATDQAGNSSSAVAGYTVVAPGGASASGGSAAGSRVGAGVTGGPSGGGPVAPLVPRVSIRRTGRVTSRARGRTFVVDPSITLTCPPGGDACSARVTATADIRAKLAGSAKRQAIGQGRATIPAGATRRLTITLTRSGAAALRRQRRLRTRVLVRARVGAAPATTSARTITIRRPAVRRRP